MGINKPNFHKRLNNESRLYLADWLIFLESFNGISMLRNEQCLSSEKYELQVFAGVLQGKWFQGKWPSLAAVTEQLLNHALTDTSKNAYQKSIDKFSEFCLRELHLTNYFPAETPSVVSFVAHLFQLGYAPSSTTTTLSAISYIHKIREVADPTAAFVIRKLLQGAAKLRPSVAMAPIDTIYPLSPR